MTIIQIVFQHLWFNRLPRCSVRQITADIHIILELFDVHIWHSRTQVVPLIQRLSCHVSKHLLQIVAIFGSHHASICTKETPAQIFIHRHDCRPGLMRFTHSHCHHTLLDGLEHIAVFSGSWPAFCHNIEHDTAVCKSVHACRTSDYIWIVPHAVNKGESWKVEVVSSSVLRLRREIDKPARNTVWSDTEEKAKGIL